MRKLGFILLQISGYFILLGGVTDFIMPFYLNSLPDSHLKFLNTSSESVSIKIKSLDFALLRAIGGCLIAIAVGTLTIIYSCLPKNIKSALFGLLAMVTIAEGINVAQMFLINSPFIAFPLGCIIITWLGATLWWIGNKNVYPD